MIKSEACQDGSLSVYIGSFSRTDCFVQEIKAADIECAFRNWSKSHVSCVYYNSFQEHPVIEQSVWIALKPQNLPW